MIDTQQMLVKSILAVHSWHTGNCVESHHSCYMCHQIRYIAVI